MRAFERACTEPGRWDRAPSADAPDAEILAYLRHCDACAYHARKARDEDRPFDRLLRAASRDLDVAGAVRSPKRRDRAPLAPGQRAAFERRLTLACILAFGIVVLWTGYAVYGPGRPAAGSAEAVVAEAPPPEGHPPPFSGRLVDLLAQRRVYTARVISDAFDGQATGSGVRYDKALPTAAVADLPFGARLRVVNPVNGASVEVTVVDRGPAAGRIHLSSAAAAALRFAGRAVVIVEVLSRPELPVLGP